MKLTSDEKDALKEYSGSAYGPINEALRFTEDIDDHSDALIKHLDSAIGKGVTDQNLTVYRGVDESYARTLERRNLRPDDSINEAGFLSTSTRKDVARRFLGWEGGGMLLKIHVPAGSNALDMRPYSKSPDEHEILLPRGAELRVIGYDPDADALELEVVN